MTHVTTTLRTSRRSRRSHVRPGAHHALRAPSDHPLSPGGRERLIPPPTRPPPGAMRSRAQTQLRANAVRSVSGSVLVGRRPDLPSTGLAANSTLACSVDADPEIAGHAECGGCDGVLLGLGT